MPSFSDSRSPDTAVTAYLGLGSSLGNRFQNLQAALEGLQELGVVLRAVSPVYESPHLGLKAGDAERYPPHLNIAAEIETALSPNALLDTVQEVEAAGGRVRLERWGPRTIDIDILDYDGQEGKTDRLILPHPGIASRAFVALPLLDVSPDFRLADRSLLRDYLHMPPLSTQPITKTSTLVWIPSPAAKY